MDVQDVIIELLKWHPGWKVATTKTTRGNPKKTVTWRLDITSEAGAVSRSVPGGASELEIELALRSAARELEAIEDEVTA